jgi:hypothetical protein
MTNAKENGTLLIHRARAVMPEWSRNPVQRRPKTVAVVALANKMARTILGFNGSRTGGRARVRGSVRLGPLRAVLIN